LKSTRASEVNSEEELMAMTYVQLIAGIGAGLVIFALMVWTPMLRDLLAAVAAAGIADLLVHNSPAAIDSVFDRMALAISGHPYFTLGLIFATTGAATLYRVLQSQ
jgi:hypothetical protein